MVSTMDGFDPLSYLPSPQPYMGNGAQNLDYMSVASGMDGLDQYSNFDSDPYMSGDEMGFHHSSGLPHPAMLKRYSTGFEDPFADSTSQFEHVPPDGDAQSPSIDRDSRYLSFSMPQFPYALLNDSFQRCSINISAQLHGMFFLAESQWPTSVDTAPPPPELTCYRRNLFQITGSITLPRSLRYIFTEEGSRIPIYELELQVSATESVEQNTVKIISVPWKTPAGGESAKPEDKIEREPPTIPLDKAGGSDMDTDYTTFPFQWKRLQFRIATANNGRRKELQQHFTLHLKVMASLSTGGKFPIAEAHSGAVIVRGRSPRNFASRKDLPLSSSSTSRKHIPSLSRASVSQTSVPQLTTGQNVQSPQEELPPTSIQFEHPQINTSGPDISSWQQQQPTSFPEQMPSTNYSLSMNPPMPAPGYVGPKSPESGVPFHFGYPSDAIADADAAVSLHFDSDNEGPSVKQVSRRSSKPPTSNPSPSLMNKPRAATLTGFSPGNNVDSYKRPRLHSQQMSSTSVPGLASGHSTSSALTAGPANLAGTSSNTTERPPNHASAGLPFSPAGESVDKLYEYFPLTVEDWQPPVDAVFRPHVVHHSGAFPPDTRSHMGGRNSKRYFSEVS